MRALLAPFRKLIRYVDTLPSSDKFIVLVLSLLIGVIAIVGVYTIERIFLVEIPHDGGTLTEGILGSPRFVNPLLALSDADRDLVALTYAGLMGINGEGELIPVLAESYSISEDGRTYTFILKEGAEFSDGTEVTAEDVVFTVEKAQDPDLKSPEFTNWANVLAEAVDARTVTFTLSRPYAPFLHDTTLGILPSHIWSNITSEEFPFSTYMTEPVGAGPFKVSDVDRNKNGIIKSYSLSSFSNYALGKPHIRNIELEFFAQKEDLVEALEGGSIQSAYGVPKENALTAPYARVFGVFFNVNQNPLFANIEVRKALSIAVNRDYIVEEVLGGYGTALAGPVPPGSNIPEIEILREGRMEEARDVLSRNDWVLNEETGIWNHEDKGELSFTLKTSNVPELKTIAQAVQADWKELGADVSIELYGQGDLTQNIIRPRSYEALLFGMVVGREQDLFAFWSSTERNDPGLNIALYTNHSVDTLLTNIREESDPLKREELLTEVQTSIAEEYPAAFTHAPDFVYVVPEEVRGVLLPQIASPSDRFANIHEWYKRTEYVWPVFAPN